ncbi:MAG: hypothetical protein NTX58_15860 [Actinobacteria bacterium]|nr:hypothetical protein [Actinomycetota bacterium]
MTALTAPKRFLAAIFIFGALGMTAAACAPAPTAPYYGISFKAPANAYVNRTFTPTPTATSGLPVTLTLDATSTACTLIGGVVTFQTVGPCVINANQPGNETFAAARQVQRTITVRDCPVLRSGLWTGPSGTSATVNVLGTNFSGSVNLTSLGFGVQSFGGSVACEVVSGSFNGTPLTGILSFDGRVLTSNYSGISIVLNAPA